MATSNMIKPFSWPPLLAVLAVLVFGIYWFAGDARKAETQAPAAQQAESSASTANSAASAGTGFTKALAQGAVAAVLVHPERKPISPFAFADATGAERNLGQWKGKVVLLNLWATWCAPCRKEMPYLVKLQQAMGGTDFEVVALSVDRKGLAASQAFLKEIGAEALAPYVDPENKSLAALQALGLPATLLIDRKGMEAARLLGGADWSSPEAQAMVKALLAEK